MCLISTVTVSSAPTRTNALGTKAAEPPPGWNARAAPDCANAGNGSATPITRPATPRRAARRDSFMSCAVMSASQRHRRILDRGANADVGGTAADIAVHGEIDVAVARLRRLAQQGDCAHHLSGLAVAALRDIAADPGALHSFGLAPAETFNGCHLSGTDRGDRQRARAQRPAVKKHRARTTLRNAAAEFGAGQSDRVAQQPK